MLPEIYAKANLIDIIKMLPYDSYILLEKIKNRVEEKTKENQIIDINEIVEKNSYIDLKYLCDAMIIVMRTNKYNRRYFINNKVLKAVDKIYLDKNKKLAEKYGKIEKIIIGILNTYGTIEENEYKKLIDLALCKNIKNSLLEELEWKRLNLKNVVSLQPIKWQSGEKEKYKTKWNLEYDEKIIINTIREQKNRNLDYKEYSAEEYIDKVDQRFTKTDLEFIKYLEKYKEINKYSFIHTKKEIESGGNEVFQNNIQKFINYFELAPENANEFLEYYMNWYNNTPQFALCGYSPKELGQKYYKNRQI